MSITHLKSNIVADFTGTVTVHNSQGSTTTVAASDLVRPSDWNSAHAPHTNEMLRCDFDATWGYVVASHIQTRNTEFQQFAINHYANAIVDIHATLTKRA